MPELPEVETVKNILSQVVVGKTIKHIEIFRPKTVITNNQEFIDCLTGATFTKMSRKGKVLVFHLNNGKVIVSHLRMEGKFFEGKEGDPFSKHDLVCFDFSDGSRLVYNDTRKFGFLGLWNESTYMNDSPYAEVGPEPFKISKEALFKGLQAKRIPIKEALLDQTMMSGLGNIYDDEVLFACSINPLTPANQMTLGQCQSIIKESIRILNQAIEAGGSTIHSYHPAEGVSGEFQTMLLAYGRKNEPCIKCGTPMKKIFVGGRGTTYCPKCQHLKGAPWKVAVTGPIHSGKSLASKYLEGKGYFRIDCDKVVAALYRNKEVVKKMVSMLGDVSSNGVIDHAALARVLSSDKNAKKKLEEYLYPLVKEKVMEMTSDPNVKYVVEVPLLVGSGMEEDFDVILMVDANEKIRRKRIEGEGRDADRLMKINEKWPYAKTKKLASTVLLSDSSVKAFIELLNSLPYLD
ncbi:MAG: DNA-formamidopyrimidine glycosylase [Bacilli bacterium]|nr:DNA-formamidopyrimidine glycosylase [Bacilli bacterium]